MSSAEKKKKVAEKRSLGQPAGKPRRVAPTNERVNNMGMGVKHYFKDGKEHKGSMHKHPDGTLMTGKSNV
jgi:hypothetical protein